MQYINHQKAYLST